MSDKLNPGAPFEVSGCVGCPGHGLVSATAGARKIVPDSGGLQHVVLTPDGKTSFLVRRNGKQVSSECPLLGYEVIRIDSDKQTERQSDGHLKTREACRELLTLVQAGWI